VTNLPELCYTRILGAAPGHRMGVIKCDVSGYYPCDYDQAKYSDEQIEDWVRLLNDRLGVTPSQRLAMETGSMFGWDVPGANPDNWKGLK